MAQSVVVSKPIQVKIVKEFVPANINIVPGSLQFVDYSGNNTIDANETCYIRMKVSNTGKGPGEGCKVRVKMTGATSALKCNDIPLKDIKPNEEISVDIPIAAGLNTKNGKVNLKVEVTEPQGFGSDPADIEVAVQSFIPPMLKIVDSSVTSSLGGTQLRKKEPFDLQLMLQNTNYGKAEDVQVTVTFPDEVFLLDGEKTTKFKELAGGKARSLVYSLNVSNNYSSTTIPIHVTIKEKYGRYFENKTINLQLNQVLAANKLSVEQTEEEKQDIQIAMIGSTVDRNIPETKNKNNNTIVVIIANEKYSNVAPVPFALNDGNIFREYCIKTLGIPSKNIQFLSNATGNTIKTTMNWLNTAVSFSNNPNVIFYYAGHGVPNEKNYASYLLPVDGSVSDLTTCFKLDDIYASLGDLAAKQVTVFMDACFSGSKREDGMLSSARSVALTARGGQLSGNMVVFSAAKGNETAYPYKEQGHGMFTYFLLSKLQETKGEVTLQDLGSYLVRMVGKESVLINKKSQTPCVTASPSVGDSWRTWVLK